MISEIFSIPSGLNVLEDVEEYYGSSRVLAYDVDGEDFDRFNALNPGIGRHTVYLFEGMLLWASPQVIDEDTPIYNGAYRGMAASISDFRRAMMNDFPNVTFDEANSGERIRVNNNGKITSLTPDFTVRLSADMNIPFLVGEIQYSEDLKGGHERAQGYLSLEGIRAVIVINIRYPWNKDEHNPLYYDEATGHMLFLYYRRNGARDPVTNEIIPDRIVSFGNTPVTYAEANRITEITKFPRTNIVGCVTQQAIGFQELEENAEEDFEPVMNCTEGTQFFPEFVHEVSPNIILVNNMNDNMTFTNHPIDTVPAHLRLTFSLFQVKMQIILGCRRMNREIERGVATVVTRPEYIL